MHPWDSNLKLIIYLPFLFEKTANVIHFRSFLGLFWFGFWFRLPFRGATRFVFCVFLGCFDDEVGLERFFVFGFGLVFCLF